MILRRSKHHKPHSSHKAAIISLILLLLIAAGFSLRGHGYKQAFFGWAYEKRLEQNRSDLENNAANSKLTSKSTLAQRIARIDYPRTANMFLQNTISEAEARQLARYDLVILGMQHQAVSPDKLKLIKQLNPNIILLAYTDPVAFPLSRLEQVEPGVEGPWKTWGQIMRKENYLLTNQGDYINIWLETPLVNLVSRVPDGRTLAEWKAQFYVDTVLGSGLWDGVFFDTTWPTISWINSTIDTNRDGVVDNPEYVNSEWARGLNTLFAELRPLIQRRYDDRYLLIGNDQGRFYEWVNGRMFEDFPNQPNGGWDGSMREYALRQRTSYPPDVTIFNSSTLNTGNQDLEFMRFTLGSALMGNAFYNYDYGNEHRSTLWWYPDYNLQLGFPQEDAKRWYDQTWVVASDWKFGVYRREFDYGIVIVNSSDASQRVQIRLRGYPSEIVIEPKHARFLLPTKE
ncbi:MAG: hypothetical protein UY09_C0014G0004 [Parcubacteria group bacterium GW2011_GWA2_47_8]|nr:MAG: hypothetical protein UY09_C0014G0004 [Parcubacteria group bacterium GW2011_GWA2_47_8]OHB18698.1 MAG: hypothetical protein A2666_02470 [Parcubacteria group bacterium RIFCSPHIGHO2_01_FULL_47_10b]